MFVYERKCEPRYGFLILNRRSANNWIQPVVADIDIQLQPPFLLYKTKVNMGLLKTRVKGVCSMGADSELLGVEIQRGFE